MDVLIFKRFDNRFLRFIAGDILNFGVCENKIHNRFWVGKTMWVMSKTWFMNYDYISSCCLYLLFEQQCILIR
ncbi:MAG: hypothetical protein JWM28_2804 [Chitinophagaceae bacterium]|nr:hypothetical protein [Chitinophagaceae bacterium]